MVHQEMCRTYMKKEKYRRYHRKMKITNSFLKGETQTTKLLILPIAIYVINVLLVKMPMEFMYFFSEDDKITLKTKLKNYCKGRVMN